MARGRSPTRSNASRQLTSTNSPSCLTNGRLSRSGSWCRSASAVAFRADKAPRDGVVLVAAQVHHPVAVGGHGDPAGRLTERAAVVVSGDHERLRSDPMEGRGLAHRDSHPGPGFLWIVTVHYDKQAPVD